MLGPLGGRYPAGLYLDRKFHDGFKYLHRLRLSFDAWLLEPQLPDLIDLARAIPGTTIVLDHVGTPLGIGRYKDKREERFAIWQSNIKTLATCPNVNVKVGGLPMPFVGWNTATGNGVPVKTRRDTDTCRRGPDSISSRRYVSCHRIIDDSATATQSLRISGTRGSNT